MKTLFFVLSVPLVVGVVVMLVLNVWLIIQNLRKSAVKKTLARYPKVGIMIPHFNEDPAHLIESLEAIEAQDYPGQLAVMLLDDGSTNGIQAHLEPWLRRPRRQAYQSLVFAQNNGSKGKALDAGLPHVAADVEAVVVVDSDTFLEPETVTRLLERLWQDEKCAAVCGFIVPANGRENFLGKLQYFEHIGVYPAIKCVQDLFGRVAVMAGACVVHRMSVVREIGGWGSWIVEDIAWTWTALGHGYSTGYAPDAIAHTYCPTTVQGLIRQRRRWARGRIEAFRAACQVSRFKGFLLSPLFFLWALSLMPPTLCLMPVLAIVLKQFWVFPLMLLSSVLYIGMFQLYQRCLPRSLRKGLGDILRANFYNTAFELFLWKPNLMGAFDEFFGKRKLWLTR